MRLGFIKKGERLWEVDSGPRHQEMMSQTMADLIIYGRCWAALSSDADITIKPYRPELP